VTAQFLGEGLPIRARRSRFDLMTDELRANSEILDDSIFDRGAQLTGHVEVEHGDGDGDDSQRERKQPASNAQLHTDLARSPAIVTPPLLPNYHVLTPAKQPRTGTTLFVKMSLD
jgi:hypothetical protein